MKKSLSILLALLLVLSLWVSGVPATENPSIPEDPTDPSDSPGISATEDPSISEEPTAPSDPPEYIYPDDWSRPALVFAVENGILQGDQNYDLKPSANITRAEAAAVMVRLLGAKEQGNLTQFRDADPTAWYYPELSAAVAAGIFNGTSATTMEPSAAITREQLMVVLCRAFGIVSADSQSYLQFTDGKNVSDYAQNSVSAMRSQGLVQGYADGTLKPKSPITRAETAQLLYNFFDVIADHPQDIPSEGRVLYRGTEPLPRDLTIEGSLLLAHGTPADLAVDHWSIRDTLVLRTAPGFDLNLKGLQTKTLVICSPGTFRAAAEEIWIESSGTVSVEGTAQKLYVSSNRQASFTGDCGSARLDRSATLVLSGSVKDVTMEAEAKLILNGSADTITVNGANASVSGNGTARLVAVYDKGVTISITAESLKNTWEEYGKYYETALQTVKTQKVPCTMQATVSMYKNRDLTGYLVTVPKGTRVNNEWNPSGNVVCVSYTDSKGKTWKGWVERWSVAIHASQGDTDGTLDYTVGTKEGFVNLLGYDSETDYLIWVSRYTQKVMVYQGSKNNWKLIKTMPCASGANSCPTPEGIHTLKGHRAIWDFGDYVVYNVTVFNGPFAFHTVLYTPNGKLLDGTVGQPRSQGCIRMRKEDNNYIYNLPLGTRVIIY